MSNENQSPEQTRQVAPTKNHRRPPLVDETKLTSSVIFSLWTTPYLAFLIFAIFFVVFYEFRSTTLIGDGLRHLPALRTIVEGSSNTFEPKPWLEAYRAHYDRVVVHNHFLFALTMRAAFAIQQKLGIAGDAIVAIQFVNAVAAAVAAVIFFFLTLRVGVPKNISLAATLGLCFSPAYLLAATNIAEVTLSLPFFLGTLLILATWQFHNRVAFAAGVLAGLAAISYFLTGCLVPCILLALIICRPPNRSSSQTPVLFLFAFALVFLGIWITVLFVSGLHSPVDLFYAIARFPSQGTYGGFRLGSLLATPIGFTEAFVAILPADFRGLRSLLRQMPGRTLFAGSLSAVIFYFLGRATYLLFKRGMIRNVLILSAVFTFLLVEAACVEWDPYYQKLQLFGLILFWIIVVTAFAGPDSNKLHRLLYLLLTAAIALSGVKVLARNIQPSQTRQNAQQLYSIVQSSVLITGWSSDVAHMWLYSNGDNIITLPEFAMARNLQVNRVETDLSAVVERAAAQGHDVYFYGVFDGDDTELRGEYEVRFRLAGFVPYLRGLQRKSRLIASFKQADGQHVTLYAYGP